MRREITTTPYQPHRWVDELPDTALANYGVWRDQAFRCEGDAQGLAYRLDTHVFGCDNRGARIAELWPADKLFEDLAVGIFRTETDKLRRKALVAIFGSAAEQDVWDLIQDCVELPGTPEGAYDLQDRICARIDHGTFNDADLAWVQAAAARQVTDEDLLGMHPFDGDQGDAKKLSRRVVRGRRDHRCHWTSLTIPAGEPRLVIKEVMDGEFIATRHSRVAAWFDVYAFNGSLAEMLKRDEAPLAAAA
ncbi:hypothetical protein [Methylorubrum suomiense]|uniref:Uncharacterized protein n=1 Tax=Methylorubrum suomiense TaxID=144191 RepID=A0ABQ4UQ99_9HYPH|nr:hypothetical protein [Methylorubrum suomiense]GJE74331.1 hypothetical protein BGCPKDLD_0900 [Methylorubrum suomiense]